MQLGVFVPIGNNGWIISTTSPQFMPSYDLNLAVVEKAEKFGFEFALSMIKLHGFGGPSQHWDHNLESFTLMAGLAAKTSRIKLFATTAVLTLPPAIAARMAVTIDSISHGRFGVNIVSGWQRREYSQMGLWPGPNHYERRYEFCAEYVQVMQDLWSTGHSNLKGQFFQMDDCRCSPLPTAKIPIISAAQSDAGTKFAAEYADYNFCTSFGENTPLAVAPSVARLVKATQQTGRKCGALLMTLIIADETDELAQAKWQHYKDGADIEALDYRDAQAADDPNKHPLSSPAKRHDHSKGRVPSICGLLVGSYASVARMLDEMAEIPGVDGVMLLFDEFISGMENFGTRVMPLMRSRAKIKH